MQRSRTLFAKLFCFKTDIRGDQNSSLAVWNVDGQSAKRCFFIALAHIQTGLAHGFNTPSPRYPQHDLADIASAQMGPMLHQLNRDYNQLDQVSLHSVEPNSHSMNRNLNDVEFDEQLMIKCAILFQVVLHIYLSLPMES